MDLFPGDLCLLLEQMTLSPLSPPKSQAASNRESMTKLERLIKLTELRFSMHRHLVMLLEKHQYIEGPQKEEMEADMEEYQELLDGLDVLIRRLHRPRETVELDGN